MFKKIKHFFYFLFIAKKSGLHKTPEDLRDFNIGLFGWFSYKPKHKRHVVKTLSVRNQENLNTCQWNVTTVQKEVDENCRLSVRSLVIKGKILGYISGNGFSNLRSGQKVLQKWGILKEGLIDEKVNNWNNYSDPEAIKGLDEEAAKHKISSYWSVNNRNEILKLLDDNRVISTGLKWYSGFNMSSGFKLPWIIWKVIGWYVGGHAILIKGYDLNYKGRKVYVCQNSYGKGWGNKSEFYIDMDYLDRNNYGFFTNLDEVDRGLAEFIINYDGKDVKSKNSSTIYRIQKGIKKPYLHEVDYFVWNSHKEKMEFEIVEDRLLDKVKKGDHMDIMKSVHWNVLKHLDKPLNYTRIIEAIKLNI